MVAEIYGGIGAFKAMFDLAKGLKDINDATIRNGAVIELQEKILTAQEAQSTLVERVSELEKQVADFETWEAEKKNYDLKSVARSAFAYMLKPDARGTKPPHWLCTQCFQNKKRSIMQAVPMHRPDIIAKCPACLNAFSSHSPPAWIDKEPAHHSDAPYM